MLTRPHLRLFRHCRPPLPLLLLNIRCRPRPGIMSTPDEIISYLSAATADANAFESLVGAPTDNNVERIRSTIVGLLQSFRYHGSQDSLSGLINPYARYLARYSHAFDRLDTSDADDYNPHMPIKPEFGKRSRCEAVFAAQKARYLLVSTADRYACLFIFSGVEETWVSEIEDSDTYFNNVLAKYLLSHFADNCNNLHNIDAVDICMSIPSWWRESLGMP